MASGDVAASFGFTPVTSTEDYRLGYVRINDAADFAMKYAKRRYSTTAALTGSTGDGIGQMATDTSTGDDYRWNGTTWQLWNTGWRTFTPTVAGLTVGNGTWTASYRYIDGAVHVTVNMTFGSTTAITGGVIVNLPIAGLNYAGVFTAQIIIGGALYEAYVQQTNSGGQAVRIRAAVVSGTAVRLNDIAAAVPAAWASGDSFEFHGIYRVY